MAFQNILFPSPKLIHSLKKEIAQLTQIVTNGTTEYRISKTPDQRARWTYPQRTLLDADKKAIIDFAKSVNMQLDSFRYFCPIEKQEFHVRFDQTMISYSVEALNLDNSVAVVNISDIVLIQVYE
jgi:hypothetical protein